MEVYNFTWNFWVLLFCMYVLQNVIATPESQNISSVPFKGPHVDVNETVDSADYTVTTPCVTNENCSNIINTTSVGSWFCNTTTQQCQFQCPKGYQSHNTTCVKGRKLLPGQYKSAVIVEKANTLNLKDTSVRLGSACDPSVPTCDFINAICNKKKCICKPPYAYPDLKNNICLKFKYEEGDACVYIDQCIRPMECKDNVCQKPDVGSQTEAFLLGFGIFVIVLLVFVTLLALIGRTTRHSRRQRQSRCRTESSPYTSSTVELMSEFRDPPPSYSDVFMIGRNRGTHKPPTYDEAMQQENLGSSSANLQVPTESAPAQNQPNVAAVGHSLVMGEGSSTSPNAEVLRTELRRYPRDNQVNITREFPELVESNV